MSPRILIIEDDAACRELFRYLLDRAGYRVMTATDGAEGLRIATAEQPDLVLCDLELPVMDGLEVLRQLRAAPGGDAVTIVALTASPAMEDRESALAAGFDGYVGKSIEPAAFVASVAAFMAPGRARRPA